MDAGHACTLLTCPAPSLLALYPPYLPCTLLTCPIPSLLALTLFQLEPPLPLHSLQSRWLQAWGQARVKPHEAVVIYTLDPVYGAAFAWLLLGETLHLQGLIGIVLVLCANIMRQVRWEAWQVTRDLVTPFPGEEVMKQWGAPRGGSSSKAVPLLG